MLEFDVDYSKEIRNRIKLSVAAYAYEYHDDPIMSDAEFDKLALQINKKTKTGNALLDTFFSTRFMPDTGMWIRKHPEQRKLEHLYKTYYKGKSNV
jgi:hypothetical protein